MIRPDLFTEKEYDLISRKLGRSGYSNYYAGLSQMLSMIEQSLIKKWSFEGLICLLEDNNLFYRFYYIWDRKSLPSDTEVTQIYDLCEKNAPIVCDFINKNGNMEEDLLLRRLGFAPYKTYCRSCGLTPRKTFRERMNIEFALDSDLENIYEMLYSTFDILSDHLPGRDELIEDIRNKGIYAARLHGELVGVLIYRDYNMKSHGVAICVKDDNKNTIVGYSLLARYVNDHRDVPMIDGWIDCTNKESIRLNAYFGINLTNESNHIYKYSKELKETPKS